MTVSNARWDLGAAEVKKYKIASDDKGGLARVRAGGRRVSPMKIEEALKVIRAQLKRMNELYGHTVFDEWAVLVMSGNGGSRVAAYEGPRAATFAVQLPKDAALLRTATVQTKHRPGDFEFVHEAAGTSLDAFVKLGEKAFLVCNHTERSMQDIRKEPSWLKGQVAWFELTERFRADPLE